MDKKITAKKIVTIKPQRKVYASLDTSSLASLGGDLSLGFYFGRVMDKVKHTPGPWEMRPENKDIKVGGYGVIAIPICGQGQAIGCVYQGMSEETKANARLIAAAPMMLETLKRLETMLYKGGHDEIVEACELEQAIAKAEGGK